MANTEFYLQTTPLLKCENDRHFFEEVYQLLKTQLKIVHCCIVSTPRMEESNPQKMRVLAGKENLNLEFWNKCQKKSREKVFFHLGDKKNQHYFFICPEKDIPVDTRDYLKSLVATFFDLSLRFEDMKKKQDLIYIDDVSGLYNQRKLNLDLKAHIERYEKHKHAFCVLFMDVDFFKKVNDSHGHLVGTRILEMLAHEFRHLLRDGDLLYRYGGDEFVVLLPDTQLSGGKIVGERILERIKKHFFEVSVQDRHLSLNMSLSIGVAECPTDAKNVEELLSFADKMMYGAKNTGRGSVFYAHDELGQKPKRA